MLYVNAEARPSSPANATVNNILDDQLERVKKLARSDVVWKDQELKRGLLQTC